jgi:hydroxymethylpyrimidine/phosphomethylpyrimidine kinase
VLDVGQSEDWLALQIALLPCLLGYSVIAKRLKTLQIDQPASTPNRYLKWIDNYVAEDYSEAVRSGCGKFLTGNRAVNLNLTLVSDH